jgi:transcriptional regulator with XRE-family HTH domain
VIVVCGGRGHGVVHPDYTIGTLLRLERGEQSPRYDTLLALAAALGKPVAALLAGEPPA